MDADFAIVGGGIGGTVLAESLGRAGQRVVVLEKSTAPPQWVRPEILWPATADVLFSLIPRGTLEREAMLPLRGAQVWERGRLLSPISQELLQQVRVQPWSTDPNQTREALLHLSAFELRRGVEVTTVLKEKQRVVGVRTRDVATGEERDVLAAWTIGDDGARSVVREACGIELRTRIFPVDFLCFKLTWPFTLPPATARFWPNLGSSPPGILGVLAVPLPKGSGAGLIPVRPRLFEGETVFITRAWERFCSADPTLAAVVGDRALPQDLVRIRRPWGHAPRYGRPGALLMGDAAHPVSPVGGQGANMSIADARALADVILRGQADLLGEYERRRRPANRRSMRFTRVAAHALGLPGWCFPPALLSFAFGWLSSHPRVTGRFVRAASTAFQEGAEE